MILFVLKENSLKKVSVLFIVILISNTDVHIFEE